MSSAKVEKIRAMVVGGLGNQQEQRLVYTPLG